MFRLAWPWLALAAVAPLLTAYFLPPARRRPGAALRIPFYARITASSEGSRRTPLGVSGALALLAWLVLVFAACRPQWVHDPREVPLSGRDLLLAVDISGSMKTRDLPWKGTRAQRLAVVKEVAGEFIARRSGDRVGLILFGSRPYLQSPLTFDRTSVRQLLEEAEIGLAGEQTAIGDAIGLALKRLRDRPAENRVLILLTDGANTAGEAAPREAAALAATHGMRIHAIGVGSGPAATLGPTSTGGGDLDEDTLRNVASLGAGRYFRAHDAAELEAIYALLDELEPVARDVELLRPAAELYPLPLGIALALAAGLLLHALGRPGRWRAQASIGRAGEN